jgi:hypothetical protein
MGGPITLADLLSDNLKDIPLPEGYKEFENRLVAMPKRRPPTVKVSPENIRQPHSTSADE